MVNAGGKDRESGPNGAPHYEMKMANHSVPLGNKVTVPDTNYQSSVNTEFHGSLNLLPTPV